LTLLLHLRFFLGLPCGSFPSPQQFVLRFQLFLHVLGRLKCNSSVHLRGAEEQGAEVFLDSEILGEGSLQKKILHTIFNGYLSSASLIFAD